MPTNTIVTGPVAGGRRGWPFSLPLSNLAPVGYVAEEFFLDGTAAAYEAEPGAELTVDGKWRVRPSRTAPFRTRVLVVRPVDRARFNGIVHVNWQNVAPGFELVSPTRVQAASRRLRVGGRVCPACRSAWVPWQ
jgi:Alpha/beta hydrolase domain